MTRHGLAALALLLALAACAPSEPPPTLGQVPSNTAPPTPTPVPSSATPTPTTTRPPVPSPRPSPTATKTRPAGPVIVIDPGHSGRSIQSLDPKTGLRDIDYPNYPEIYEMFDVSYCLQQSLHADGYRSTLTKTRALDSVSLAQRAAVANRAQADLAVSVHDDHSQTASFQATYSQLGVNNHEMYRGTGKRRTVFSLRPVAKRSAGYAEIIARERSRAQGRRVTVRENVFTGRPPLEPGNLALVQLLATVPWVYNEAGARTGGNTTRAMSITTETAYARGLLLGIEAAVPIAGGRVAQPSAGAKALRGCLTKRIEPTPGEFTRPKRYLPDGYRP